MLKVNRCLFATVEEAARMLSIGESTLWRLSRAGKLPAPVKIGSATRWRVRDIERLQDSPPRNAESDEQPIRVEVASLQAESMYLTTREVNELTGISRADERRSKEERQVEALRMMRVPHYVNPFGRIFVPRAAVNQGRLAPAQITLGRGVDLSKVS